VVEVAGVVEPQAGAVLPPQQVHRQDPQRLHRQQVERAEFPGVNPRVKPQAEALERQVVVAVDAVQPGLRSLRSMRKRLRNKHKQLKPGLKITRPPTACLRDCRELWGSPIRWNFC
jgi:hypothetical protein